MTTTTATTTTTTTMADLLNAPPLPPLRAQWVPLRKADGNWLGYEARLPLVEAGRGPYAPCHCCGRMTSCLMDPTLGAGVRRPWCMWHALSEAPWRKSRPRTPGTAHMTPDYLERARRQRRLAHIARRRAAAAFALDR